MQTIGIIGLGLIGGSIARALKWKSAETLIIASSRSEQTLQQARSDRVIDHYTKKIDESFSACDVIFICVPVAETEIIAEQLRKFTSKDTIVTDVGSTKSRICQQMSRFKEDFTFIGGHPMAGSEQSGYQASKHYLFENAYYPLTPYKDTPEEKVEELRELIETTGALPLVMEAEEHDFIVGAISHVPHVVAMSLVNSVSSVCKNKETAVTLASGGFKDITRVASSSPKMWNDISIQNKANILSILTAFKETIEKYEGLLSCQDEKGIYAMFESGKAFRDEFKASRRHSNANVIGVDLEDKPGGISFVTTALAYHGINIKNIGIANNRDFGGGILEIVVENSEEKKKGAEILRRNGFVVHE